MLRLRHVLILIMVAILVAGFGCLRKTITDTQIEESVQAYLDAPADPADEHSLTPEERAAVEGFRVFHEKIKVQLVAGTEQTMWEDIGRKMVRAFAMACRDASVYETNYYCELRIEAEVEGETDNFLVGELRFQNSSERIFVDMYNPSRSRH
jgi:hypothetical protein